VQRAGSGARSRGDLNPIAVGSVFTGMVDGVDTTHGDRIVDPRRLDAAQLKIAADASSSPRRTASRGGVSDGRHAGPRRRGDRPGGHAIASTHSRRAVRAGEEDQPQRG